MKTWNSYGSEHSANLVMIGSFKDATSAQKAQEVIDEITSYICDGDQEYEGVDRYPEGTRAFLEKCGFYPSPPELSQFRMDIRSKVKDNKVIIETDEDEISGFLKLLVTKGARVEVYSAHDYPDTGVGRDTRE